MKGDSLTKKDVPKYIREIAARLYLQPCQNSEGGYTLKLYGKWKLGYTSQLEADATKLVAWARRHYAEAEILSTNFWWTRFSNLTAAYTARYRNHIIIDITDPVIWLFERENFFR